MPYSGSKPRSTRQHRYITFLREQAARCYRTAERIDDPQFAKELTDIGRELEQKADQLEGGDADEEAAPK